MAGPLPRPPQHQGDHTAISLTEHTKSPADRRQIWRVHCADSRNCKDGTRDQAQGIDRITGHTWGVSIEAR